MPLFLPVALVLVAVLVYLLLMLIKKKRVKNSVFIGFLFNFLCILIGAQVFINIAHYADETGSSVTKIFGGDMGVNLSWIQLLLNIASCILLGSYLLKKK